MIRRAFIEIPPRVEYELFKAGVDLMPTSKAMLDWSLKYDALLNGETADEHDTSP